jgi:predicted nuclease of restriction endonuclease-like RecB superfamily
MLTGPLVRVRYARDRILPYFIDPANEEWREVAEQLRELFLAHQGRTRGEVEAAIDEMFGDDNDTLVQRGLAKLLEDRCGFETAPGLPPEQLRQEVFKAAVEYRLAPTEGVPAAFDRDEVLRRVGLKHSLTPEQILLGLYADLKSEQRLIEFEDISAEHLLQRYNVALAQSILLRAVRVHVTITGEPPPRWRAILRRLKFHRLLCEVERVLPCRDFAMKAELKWGTQKKDKTFLLSNKDRLTWPGADPGQYVPPELTMFVESFRKRITDWELREETDVHQLGNAFWVPDFRLTHRPSGRSVLLEVMGFWRRSSAEKHLAFLRRYAREPFVLAVSDQLHIDEGELGSLPAGVARFKHLPLADEVARLADAALRGTV